ARQSAENTASYAFGGPVNTVAQGNPVAIGYGERRIGGAIISAGVYAEDKT
ncbi:tail assembly protein, partial [Yersinia enterocolitica]